MKKIKRKDWEKFVAKNSGDTYSLVDRTGKTRVNEGGYPKKVGIRI